MKVAVSHRPNHNVKNVSYENNLWGDLLLKCSHKKREMAKGKTQ